MEKEKNEKVIRQKTKRFTLTSKGKIGPENSVEIRSRLSKSERKIQKRIDEETVLASIVFTDLDEYKCTEMKVSLVNGGIDLATDEWAEIMKFILESNVTTWNAAFVLIDKNNLPANMLPAVNDFKIDPVKSGYHYYEVPVSSMFAFFWLMGMSLGMSIGIASGNQSVGMCLGLGVGMCLGVAFDSASKKKRKELKIARGMPVEEPDKKTEKNKK